MAVTEFGRREARRGARWATDDDASGGAEVAGDLTGSGEPVGSERDLGPPVDPETAARAICLRLLDRRARTRLELAEALAARQVPADAADAVLDRFAEVGLIDDAGLAAGYAETQHTERGLAARAVAQKLRRRGVADEQIADAVAGIDRDAERATAERLVARKLRSLAGLNPQVQIRRLVGLLARKGYSPGLAYEIVRRAVDADVDVDVDQDGYDA